MTSLTNIFFLYALRCVVHVVPHKSILTPFRRIQKFKHNHIVINTDTLLYTHVYLRTQSLNSIAVHLKRIQAGLCYSCYRVPGDNFRISKSSEFKIKHTHTRARTQTHTHTHTRYIYMCIQRDSKR